MLTKYKTIILALELISKNDKPLIEKAQLLAKQNKSKIILVHAIEHLSSYTTASYGISSIDPEIENILLNNARKEMEKLGKKLDIPRKNQIINIGSAKFVVIEEAEKAKADLIVIGSRGNNGIRLLIGSTANAVLHSAHCDVLAVRIKN